MQTEAEKRLLFAVGSALKEQGLEAELYDSEKGPVLAFAAASPFSEEDELYYSISTDRPADGFVLFELMIILFQNVPEELFSDLHRILECMNVRTVIGRFSLFEPDAAILYSDGIILDEDVGLSDAAENIMKTVSLMETAAANVGTLLKEYFEGQMTAAELLDLLNGM